MTDPTVSASHSPQVLIVDDNADAAISLSMLLDLEDITSTTAPDAETALELVQKSICPPLMLIDIGLPGMNGYDLAQTLRQLPRTQRSTLIALTGRDLPTGEEGVAGTPFDQMWAKPFDPKKLLAEIKAILSRSAPR